MEILSIPIHNLTQKECLAKANSFLQEEKFHQIATVGAEFILKAQNDNEFKTILKKTDLNVADGISIFFAGIKYGYWLKERFPGIDLMLEILKIAEQNKLRVYLIANSEGLCSWEQTAEKIKKDFPGIEIGGINISQNSRQKIQITNYPIVLCNFGAPEQEKFLQLVKNDTIRIAMGVGGAFDFIAGTIPRAPKIIRKLGFEWLYRLIQQPLRIDRIINAVIIFPLLVLFNRNGK